MREIKIVDEKRHYDDRVFKLVVRWDENHCESTNLTKEELQYIKKLISEKVGKEEYVKLTENDITRPGDEIKWSSSDRFIKCGYGESGCRVKDINLNGGVEVRRPITR